MGIQHKTMIALRPITFIISLVNAVQIERNKGK